MTPSLDREALAAWAFRLFDDTRIAASSSDTRNHNAWRTLADAIRELVEAKVREAVEATKDATDPYCECDNSGTGGPIHIRFDATDAIVAKVMGDSK